MPHARQLLNWIMAYFFLSTSFSYRWPILHVRKCTGIGLTEKRIKTCFAMQKPRVGNVHFCTKWKIYIHSAAGGSHTWTEHRYDTYQYALTVLFFFFRRQWIIAPIQTMEMLAHVVPQATQQWHKGSKTVANIYVYFVIFRDEWMRSENTAHEWALENGTENDGHLLIT